MGNRQTTTESVLKTLRTEGKRITSAKRSVVSYMVEHNTHHSAEEITQAVQVLDPRISSSTVYRILEELEHFGFIEHTHSSRAAATYHLIGDDHGHVTCERCQVTFEVPDQLFDTLARELLDSIGFDLHRHHVTLSGRCQKCRVDG